MGGGTSVAVPVCDAVHNQEVIVRMPGMVGGPWLVVVVEGPPADIEKGVF